MKPYDSSASTMSEMDLFTPQGDAIERINADKTYRFLLDIHYAGRIPSISYAFGLFRGGEIVGVVTFGRPAGSPQRTGVCGEENAHLVYELNRLCLRDNIKNEASRLVSAALKMLPSPSVIISYADPEQGHVGYIYQATNFIYCGLTEKRTDWAIKGMEHLHGQTIADKYRHCENRAEEIRKEHGEDFYLKDRPRKHRYIYIIGSKGDRRRLRQAIRYEIAPYPKK